MPHIPTTPFQPLITPSNFIGPFQPPSSASNVQQQRLLLPPPSVTLPIQHVSEPFTTPPSTSLSPLAANSKGQADLRVAFPIDKDRHSFANELVKTLNTTFTGTPQHTINPLQLHVFYNDFDLNNPATHSESYFIESTLMGLMFLNLDDGQWNGDDSDEIPNHRHPQGALLRYIVICDFMYILDNPIPLGTSSNEASKRPIWNRTFTSCSSLSLSSDDVDLQETQPSGATSPC
jgi:hypothetical protein